MPQLVVLEVHALNQKGVQVGSSANQLQEALVFQNGSGAVLGCELTPGVRLRFFNVYFFPDPRMRG